MSTNSWQLEQMARARRAELEQQARSYSRARPRGARYQPHRAHLDQAAAFTGALLVRIGTRLVEAAEPEAACCPPPSGSLRVS